RGIEEEGAGDVVLGVVEPHAVPLAEGLGRLAQLVAPGVRVELSAVRVEPERAVVEELLEGEGGRAAEQGVLLPHLAQRAFGPVTNGFCGHDASGMVCGVEATMAPADHALLRRRTPRGAGLGRWVTDTVGAGRRGASARTSKRWRRSARRICASI